TAGHCGQVPEQLVPSTLGKLPREFTGPILHSRFVAINESASQSLRRQRAQSLQQLPKEVIEMKVVGLAAVLVALEPPSAIRRGMVLDARGGLSDAQNHPRS